MRAKRARVPVLIGATAAATMSQVSSAILRRPAVQSLFLPSAWTAATNRACFLRSQFAGGGAGHRRLSRVFNSARMEEEASAPSDQGVRDSNPWSKLSDDDVTAGNTALPGSEGVMRNGILASDPFRPRPQLRRCLDDVPNEPGVYIMESAKGRKLYIGKSVKLSSRVPSYFSYGSNVKSDINYGNQAQPAAVVLPGSNLSRRIAVMTTLVERIEYIATASGAEALLLEASLIRQHQPPFNVLLKDDKRNYPYVCITWSEPYPRLLITRDRPRAGGGKEDRYFGPFVDPGQLKLTVALVRRVLPLRERRRPLYKDKPCLNYDIGLCPGACQKLISEDEYAETVRMAEMVFRGQGTVLLEKLRQRMNRASIAEKYEKAGEIKDQMALVRGGLLGSALHFSSGGAVVGGVGLGGEDLILPKRSRSVDGIIAVARRDVVAVGLAGNLACFQVFRVKDGRLIGRLGFTYRVEEEGLSRGEVLQACLEQYWGNALASVAFSQTGEEAIFSSKNQSSFSPSVSLEDPEVGAASGDYFVDVPDEIVTADALPEAGRVLLAELLSEAKSASLAVAVSADGITPAFVFSADTDGAETVTGVERTGDGSDRESSSSKVSRKGRKKKSKPTVTVKVVHGEGTGDRHHLCVMVAKNAELEAKRLLKGGEVIVEGLSQLARMLGLSSPPTRIEGFDISHTGGGQAVGSLVSFNGGKADPKGHRRYRIKTPDVKKGHSDDFASLREVIARRFSPPRNSGSIAAADLTDTNPLPDLVLIDGGKGQLAAALEGAADAAAEWRSQRRAGTTNGRSDDHNNEVDCLRNDDLAREAIDPREVLPVGGVPANNGVGRHPSSTLRSSGTTETDVDDHDDPDAVLSQENADTSRSRPTSNGHPRVYGGDGKSSRKIMVDVGGRREVAFVSLAKKEEEVFVPRDLLPLKAAVEAGPDSPGLMILRQVRDEAHRFAVAYHRKLRSKNMFQSKHTDSSASGRDMSTLNDHDGDDDGDDGDDQGGFDQIAGLSAKSRAVLVQTFGSLEQARVAGEAELRRIPGIGPKIARRILG